MKAADSSDGLEATLVNMLICRDGLDTSKTSPLGYFDGRERDMNVILLATKMIIRYVCQPAKAVLPGLRVVMFTGITCEWGPLSRRPPNSPSGVSACESRQCVIGIGVRAGQAQVRGLG